MKWIPSSLGHIPEGSIIGGYRRGKPRYYIARVKHEGMVIVGKVSFFQTVLFSNCINNNFDILNREYTSSPFFQLQIDGKIAHVPFNGQELPFTNYEVLVQIMNTVSPLSAAFITGPNNVPTSVPSTYF